LPGFSAYIPQTQIQGIQKLVDQYVTVLNTAQHFSFTHSLCSACLDPTSA